MVLQWMVQLLLVLRHHIINNQLNNNIHINNSNPLLISGSPERDEARDAGWDVAYDGMEITL